MRRTLLYTNYLIPYRLSTDPEMYDFGWLWMAWMFIIRNSAVPAPEHVKWYFQFLIHSAFAQLAVDMDHNLHRHRAVSLRQHGFLVQCLNSFDKTPLSPLRPLQVLCLRSRSTGIATLTLILTTSLAHISKLHSSTGQQVALPDEIFFWRPNLCIHDRSVERKCALIGRRA